MNTPSYHDDPEARLTALILGELSGDEAAAVRTAMAQDPELAQLHDRLKRAITLIRGAIGSRPADQAPAEPAPRLSEPKRKTLLAQFKVVPLKTDPAKKHGLQWMLLPLRIAALLILLGWVAVLSLPDFIRVRESASSNAVINNLRQLDGAKQQWALENRLPADAAPTMNDLLPYLGRSGQGIAPVVGETYQLGKVSESPSAKLKAGGEVRLYSEFSVAHANDAQPRSAGSYLGFSQNEAVTEPDPADRRWYYRQVERGDLATTGGGGGFGGGGGGMGGGGASGPADSGGRPIVGRTSRGGSVEIALPRLEGVLDPNPYSPEEPVSAGISKGATVGKPSSVDFYGTDAVTPQTASGIIVSRPGSAVLPQVQVVVPALGDQPMLGQLFDGLEAGGENLERYAGVPAQEGAAVAAGESTGGVDRDPMALYAFSPVNQAGGAQWWRDLSDEKLGAVLDKAVEQATAPQDDRLALEIAREPVQPSTLQTTRGLSLGRRGQFGAKAMPKPADPGISVESEVLRSARGEERVAGRAAPAAPAEERQRRLSVSSQLSRKLNEEAVGKSDTGIAEGDAVRFGTVLEPTDAEGLVTGGTSLGSAISTPESGDWARYGFNSSSSLRIGVVAAGQPANPAALLGEPAVTRYAASVPALDTDSSGPGVQDGSMAYATSRLDAPRGTFGEVAQRGFSNGATSHDAGDAGAGEESQMLQSLSESRFEVGARLGEHAQHDTKDEVKAAEIGEVPQAGEKVVEVAVLNEDLSRVSDARSVPAKETPPPVPQPEVTTTDNPFSTFSLNVADVSFKLAAASLEQGQMPAPASIRSEEFINAFDYHDPEPRAGQRVGVSWDRARYPFAHNRDLLRFGVQTAAQGREASRPLNVVLCLDNSGSMERADRVAILREAMTVLASQLQPQDQISVVAFARTARLWVDGLSGAQADTLVEQVGNLSPEGGTNLEEALRLAYETARRHFVPSGINRVVLLTDGAANLGTVDPESLRRTVMEQRRNGLALDCFGVGWEGYNDDLLENLSRNADGRYGFLNTPEEAATEFANELAGALRVAASDVKVQVEFNPRRVKTYRQIGYAHHQLTKEQFRDNTVDAAEIGAAESGNALYVIETDTAGAGPLGVVRVRFKVPETGQVEESEWVIPYEGPAADLARAAAPMRLAGTACAFSEWLATSPYAGEVQPDKLLQLLSRVPEVFRLDPRPRQLEWMIRQAGSIAGR